MIDNLNHPDLDQIQAFIDKALDEQSLLDIQDHLGGCSACQKELNRLELAISRLADLPEISLSKDLSNAVLTEISNSKKITSGLTWILAIETLAAGAVIGALIPVFQSATWLSQFINTRQDLLAAMNIFLTQLASNWMIWWAQLQLNFKVLLDPLQDQLNLLSTLPSPWILLLTAALLGIFINYFMLRTNPIRNNNHQH